jgi:hypothetical protein
LAKRILLTVLFLCLLPWPVFAGPLEDLLARNAEAVGGSENWALISNVRVQLDIEGPDFKVSATYVATRQGNMRINIQMDGKMAFSEGLNQGKAWKWTPAGGAEQQDEASASALRNGIQFPGRFFTLQDLHQNGTRVTLEGELFENDRRQWRVRVTLEDGFSRDYFIDDMTAVVVREHDRRAFHPAADPDEVLIETRKEEPAWIDGTLYFQTSRNINLETGEWLATTRVKTIEHNIDLSEAYFLPPDQPDP